MKGMYGYDAPISKYETIELGGSSAIRSKPNFLNNSAQFDDKYLADSPTERTTPRDHKRGGSPSPIHRHSRTRFDAQSESELSMDNSLDSPRGRKGGLGDSDKAREASRVREQSCDGRSRNRKHGLSSSSSASIGTYKQPGPGQTGSQATSSRSTSKGATSQRKGQTASMEARSRVAAMALDESASADEGDSAPSKSEFAKYGDILKSALSESTPPTPPAPPAPPAPPTPPAPPRHSPVAPVGIGPTPPPRISTGAASANQDLTSSLDHSLSPSNSFTATPQKSQFAATLAMLNGGESATPPKPPQQPQAPSPPLPPPAPPQIPSQIQPPALSSQVLAESTGIVSRQNSATKLTTAGSLRVSESEQSDYSDDFEAEPQAKVAFSPPKAPHQAPSGPPQPLAPPGAPVPSPVPPTAPVLPKAPVAPPSAFPTPQAPKPPSPGMPVAPPGSSSPKPPLPPSAPPTPALSAPPTPAGMPLPPASQPKPPPPPTTASQPKPPSPPVSPPQPPGAFTPPPPKLPAGPPAVTTALKAPNTPLAPPAGDQLSSSIAPPGPPAPPPAISTPTLPKAPPQPSIPPPVPTPPQPPPVEAATLIAKANTQPPPPVPKSLAPPGGPPVTPALPPKVASDSVPAPPPMQTMQQTVSQTLKAKSLALPKASSTLASSPTVPLPPTQPQLPPQPPHSQQLQAQPPKSPVPPQPPPSLPPQQATESSPLPQPPQALQPKHPAPQLQQSMQSHQPPPPPVPLIPPQAKQPQPPTPQQPALGQQLQQPLQAPAQQQQSLQHVQPQLQPSPPPAASQASQFPTLPVLPKQQQQPPNIQQTPPITEPKTILLQPATSVNMQQLPNQASQQQPVQQSGLGSTLLAPSHAAPLQHLPSPNGYTTQQDDKALEKLSGAWPKATSEYLRQHDDKVLEQLRQQGGPWPNDGAGYIRQHDDKALDNLFRQGVDAQRDDQSLARLYNASKRDDQILEQIYKASEATRRNSPYRTPSYQAGIAQHDDQALSKLYQMDGMARQDDSAFEQLCQTGGNSQTMLQQQDDDAMNRLLFGASGNGVDFARRGMADSFGQTAGTMASAQWQVDSFGQQILSDALRKFDGSMSKAAEASLHSRRASVPSSGGSRRHSAGGTKRTSIEIRRKDDLLRISRCLNTNDLTLQRDIFVDDIMLPRGLRILRLGSLKGCSLVRAALERLEPWATLVFERPGMSGGEPVPIPVPILSDVAERSPEVSKICEWRCPACGSHYPVRFPEDATAAALLEQLLPQGSYILDGPERDLWLLAELHLPSQAGIPTPDSSAPRDAKGHMLKPFRSPFPTLECGECGIPIGFGVDLFGCLECQFYVCTVCQNQAVRNGGSFGIKPLQSSQEQVQENARKLDELRLSSLRRFSVKHFNVGPLMHFGSIRCLRADLPEIQRYCQRSETSALLPLGAPYDYYARAALLHKTALDCPSAAERQCILQEAREAILAPLRSNHNSGSNHLSQQQFGFAKTYNPRGMSVDLRTMEDKAAVDPRFWYLLGLILCDLRSFREARLVYRQVLSRLPMSCFGHVVHYNLACLQALQAEDASREASLLEASALSGCEAGKVAALRKRAEAAKVAALRDLKEFRRHCRALQSMGRSRSISSCELCGAPQ